LKLEGHFWYLFFAISFSAIKYLSIDLYPMNVGLINRPSTLFGDVITVKISFMKASTRLTDIEGLLRQFRSVRNLTLLQDIENDDFLDDLRDVLPLFPNLEIFACLKNIEHDDTWNKLPTDELFDVVRDCCTTLKTLRVQRGVFEAAKTYFKDNLGLKIAVYPVVKKC
jgi:hypothetical protein